MDTVETDFPALGTRCVCVRACACVCVRVSGFCPGFSLEMHCSRPLGRQAGRGGPQGSPRGTAVWAEVAHPCRQRLPEARAESPQQPQGSYLCFLRQRRTNPSRRRRRRRRLPSRPLNIPGVAGAARPAPAPPPALAQAPSPFLGSRMLGPLYRALERDPSPRDPIPAPGRALPSPSLPPTPPHPGSRGGGAAWWACAGGGDPHAHMQGPRGCGLGPPPLPQAPL